ncbi:myelin-associated glycoprotein [Salmo salar]|uniref:Myelin-associated glycoprotein n=3 Tax=Salmo salar TaxID=8030 RepID=B5X4C4_SALSA|nr:myelin-associated glycoprotein [Salmo salar]ACI34155.1 Myelin-associated glycoprotein precursor [Salmo salar]|eukprot:NP_001133927.1 myelin-associated glycoprotein [Salmo salar]
MISIIQSQCIVTVEGTSTTSQMGLWFIAFTIFLLKGALCQQWSLWMPQSIVAVGGSCLMVPCRFQIPAEFDAPLKNCTLHGLWKKHSEWGNIVFHSAQTDAKNIIKGVMLGNLLNKNCTTIFNSFSAGYDDTYIFRLECAGTNPLKYSFLPGVNINHTVTPPRPQLIPMGNIIEGEQGTLSCSAPAPCPTLPPSLTWTSGLGGSVESQLQEGIDGLMTMISTLTFTASLPHHGLMVKCSARYTLQPGGTTKTTQGNLTLNVLYAPKNTVALSNPTGPVPEGRAVTLTCQSDANPPVERYSWYKDISGQVTWKANGQTLVLLVSKADSGLYLCEAHNQNGSQRSKAMPLEFESDQFFKMAPYIICGVMVLLYVLTVTVDVYKYKSLSRRLKQIELSLSGKADNTYTNLRIASTSSDYDELQMTRAAPGKARAHENPNGIGRRSEIAAP